MKTKIKNISDLLNDLNSVYEGLRNKEIGINDAKTIARVSSTIIRAATVQMERQKMTGKRWNIPYVDL